MSNETCAKCHSCGADREEAVLLRRVVDQLKLLAMQSRPREGDPSKPSKAAKKGAR